MCFLYHLGKHAILIHFFQPTEAVAGTTITLGGRGFIPTGSTLGANINTITVLINNAPCQNVIAHSSTPDTDEIRCRVTDYETGYYSVDVFVDGKGYAQSIDPAVFFFLTATANAISPMFGSRLGGTAVTISGSGFSYLPSHVDVQIGGSPCRVLSSTLSEINCITSAASASSSTAEVSIRVNGYPVRSSLQFEQSSTFTPTITQLDRHTVIGGDLITITGTNFGMEASEVQVRVTGTLSDFDVPSRAKTCAMLTISDTSITCTAPTMPAGSYQVHVLVQQYGFADATGDNSLSYLLTIESFSPTTGGNGGGITVTIEGDGFPDLSSNNSTSVVVALCNNQVQCSVTQSSNNRLMCELNANSQSEQNCSITIAYNGMSDTSSELFQFSSLLTPLITGLSPTVGGTAGGTIVSLTGSGFFPVNVTDAAELEEGDVIVTIDQAECEWYGHNYHLTDTNVTCRTSEHRTTLEAIVRVFVRGKGYATYSGEVVTFEYIDRWSSRYTWGGADLPREGESVYIKPGQTVFLDISTPVLNLILIEGTLIFEDEQDLHLQAKYIFINGGKLQVRPDNTIIILLCSNP